MGAGYPGMQRGENVWIVDYLTSLKRETEEAEGARLRVVRKRIRGGDPLRQHVVRGFLLRVRRRGRRFPRRHL